MTYNEIVVILTDFGSGTRITKPWTQTPRT